MEAGRLGRWKRKWEVGMRKVEGGKVGNEVEIRNEEGEKKEVEKMRKYEAG